MAFKTKENWTGSLSEYLQKGDIVDEEMYYYFIEVLPPATFTNRIVQIGEPDSHINGRATYSTLAYTPDGWMYCGNCHRGEIEEPIEERLTIKFIKSTGCLALENAEGTDYIDYEMINKWDLEDMNIADLEVEAMRLADRNLLERFRFNASEFFNQ